MTQQQADQSEAIIRNIDRRRRRAALRRWTVRALWFVAVGALLSLVWR
jgi:hypothetical protein